MPEYTGTPDFTHGMPPRLGLLLVNLGTPDAPTTRAVRRYLAEFLSDPRVVEAPRALWWLALHGVVLRIRPRRSAAAYARIWTPQGSPLLVHSEALAQALQRRLAVRFGDRVLVSLAMSYGLPSIGSALEHLRRQNVRRLLVLPLYPQYSGTTTASVFARVTAELARWRWIPELRFVNDYHDEEAYLAAVADSVAEHWRVHGRKHLLFSFHSIPQRYFDAGDPYHCQCQATARGVAARLDLAAEDWSVAFQSRIGREPWLQPYTDVLLEKYAQSGPRQLTVVCPGFAVDCLETLEEIDIRNRAAFFVRGGEEFDYVPCLNSSESHTHLLEQLLLRHAYGWPEIEGRAILARLHRRERALAMGAPVAAVEANDISCHDSGEPATVRPPIAAAWRRRQPNPAALSKLIDMLGRFLEVSVHTPDVRASLAFYESIGFVQATVGEVWTHPYAVVTDGHLYIGLHGTGIPSPSLTWVWPNLASHAPELEALGIEFNFARFGEEAFHELGFSDPSGHTITLLEARTFSPLAVGHAPTTAIGYFEEFGLPTGDLDAASAFWDKLGLVAFDRVEQPFPKAVLAGSDINVGLYDLELRAPVLAFSDPQMGERIEALRERGFRFQSRLPRGLDPRENAILEAPEGTPLLLMKADE